MLFSKSLHTTLISSVAEELGEIGITDFILKNKLDPCDVQVEISTSIHGAEPVTMRIYHERWKDLRRFAFLRGDYQSATLLDRVQCPRNPYPLDPKTLCEYIFYKSFSTSTLLYEYGTKEPARDVENILGALSTGRTRGTHRATYKSLLAQFARCTVRTSTYGDRTTACVMRAYGATQIIYPP